METAAFYGSRFFLFKYVLLSGTMNGSTKKKSLKRGKRKISPGKKNRKNKTVLSLEKTAVLCIVIITACFLLLFINSKYRTDTEGTPESPVSSTNKTSSRQEYAKNEKDSSFLKSSVPPVAPAETETSAAQQPRKSPESPVLQKKNIPGAEKSSVQAQKPHSPVVPGMPAVPPAVNNAKLVFVFDDAGQNMSQLEKYVTLPFPVTVAVLPKLTYSRPCADRVRKSGNEVMLHQPMQAVNRNVNPGPGAITPDMQSAQIAALVRQNIEELGPVAGVNNHEGSLISEDEVKIGTVMRTAEECGAFFLDSRTTNQTRVPQASMELGIPYYERNVFLDNSKDRTEIIREIIRGLDIANTKGAVIMIGHVWSADVLPAVLIEMYPVLRNKGYVFTTVSKSGAVIKP